MRYFIKILFIGLALIICVTNIHAQVSLLQKAIDKIENSKNLSYQELFISKNPAGDDTTIWLIKSLFATTPEDKNYGYFFKTEIIDSVSHIAAADTYNGNSIIHLNLHDSTYEIWQPDIHELGNTLIGRIRWTKNFLEKHSSKIKQANDTVINSIVCAHFVAHTFDTIINKEHYYGIFQWFVDKSSNNILAITQKSKDSIKGYGLMNDYTQSIYSDYKFNQDNVDVFLSVTVPENFRPYEKPTLLKSGTIAPDWTLYSTDSKKLSLSELKGKVVLIDFSFIGCAPCMRAIPIMNKFHKKYAGKDIDIISIYFRDNNEAVEKFIQDYNIKYPVYANANEVAKLYGVNGGPYFYFIDKNGIINKVYSGLSDDFEEQASSIIDDLLSK